MTKCPFEPSCSNYCISSIKNYGAIKGILLGGWRILRCNPFNKGYFDPPQNWGRKLYRDPKTKSKKQIGHNG